MITEKPGNPPTVKSQTPSAGLEYGKEEKTITDETTFSLYDVSERPFDFVEEGAETAILCEPDPAIRVKISIALKDMGYYIAEPGSAIEALKRMYFHPFDIIVLNELFDTENPEKNRIIKYLDRLVMASRRNTFVALVTTRFRTMDSMSAFNKSVNIVINLKNIDKVQEILMHGITDNREFYRHFKEALARFSRV